MRAFATAWGVTDGQIARWDAELDAHYATVMTRLWATLSSFVRIR